MDRHSEAMYPHMAPELTKGSAQDVVPICAHCPHLLLKEGSQAHQLGPPPPRSGHRQGPGELGPSPLLSKLKARAEVVPGRRPGRDPSLIWVPEK